MARRLLVDGNDLWSILSADGHPVLWLHLVKHLEESFGTISGCRTRLFSNKVITLYLLFFNKVLIW